MQEEKIMIRIWNTLMRGDNMALETYNMNNINKTRKQRNDDFNAVKSE
jgi:hypothetical protein